MRKFNDFLKFFFFMILSLLLHYALKNDKSKIYNKLYFTSDIKREILCYIKTVREHVIFLWTRTC